MKLNHLKSPNLDAANSNACRVQKLINNQSDQVFI